MGAETGAAGAAAGFVAGAPTVKRTNSAASGSAAEAGAAGANTDGQETSAAADHILTQADIDAAVEAAKARWEAELKTQIQTAKDEGAKLAKMTAEERQAEEARIERENFEKEKAEFAHKSLVAEVKTQLADKGLPVTLAEMVAQTDAESAKSFLEALEAEWTKAIEEAVTRRLAGRTPNLGGQTVGQTTGDFFEIIKENQRF